MVKSITLTLAAIILCIAFFIFVEWYLNREFNAFYEAVDCLYDKTEEMTATREDADAVRALWADKRSKLHIFIPHNDISYVDYRLNEALSLIYTDDFSEALSNLEIVRQMAKNLPDNYTLKLENIF